MHIIFSQHISQLQKKKKKLIKDNCISVSKTVWNTGTMLLGIAVQWHNQEPELQRGWEKA